VFNSVLRGIVEPKIVREATGVWRKLHTKELNKLYLLTQFIRVIKSRMVRKP
jgi:hypothetical protein